MTYETIRRRLTELMAAVVIVAGILYIANQISQRQRANLPAEAWFVVNEIFVPDHVQGSNPQLIYDRTILAPFLGFWVVEVQKQEENGLFSLVCQGSAISDYTPDDYIPENKVTWEWLIGKPCEIPPGKYRLRASWKMKRADWPEKQYVALSNIFEVGEVKRPFP